MTAHTTTYIVAGSHTFTAPSNLISSSLAVLVIGGAAESPTGARFGAYVSGQVPVSLLPLTVYVGSSGGSSSNGANGFSGGGGGATGAFGGGGSSALLTGGTTLVVESGAADGGPDGVGGDLGNPGGSGGGNASNTPINAVADTAAGSGGSQGGTGGTGAASGGTGAGGGTNGNSASGLTSGAGVGSGGLAVSGCASSSASSSVSGFTYGQASQGPAVSISYHTADAPNPPVLVSPLNLSYADTNADGITLVGTYQTPGADTGSLIGVAVSLKIDGGTVHYWNGTDFSSLSPVFLVPDTGVGARNGESFSVVIPAGVLSDGHTYTWSMSTQESFANLIGAAQVLAVFSSGFGLANSNGYSSGVVITSSNNQFTWVPANTGIVETFTIAPGTYSTVITFAAAIGAATGSAHGEAFSTLFTVTPVGSPLPLRFTAVVDGPAFNGTLTFGTNGALPIVLSPTVVPMTGGASATFIGAQAPVADLTSPAATESTLTPTVAWTPTTPAGSQTDYRFVVYAAPTATPGEGSPLYDSTLVASASTSFAIPSSTLHSVRTYHGYLQITETGGQTSRWVPVVFTVQLNDPAVPTLSGSVTNEPTSGCPAPLLSANAVGGGGGTADPNIVFQASYDGGTTWADILGLTDGVTAATATVTPDISGDAAIYDMGAAFNVALQYRCRNVAVSGGETYVSDWSSVVDL